MDEDDKKKQLIIDYMSTFGMESGKRVLENLKMMTKFNYGISNPMTANGHIDPYDVMRQEGMRSVIIHIEKMLNKDPNETKGISNER